MIFRTPSYYDSFCCIADKCTDNCCIGWEIAIDSETADYYTSLDGTFGDRLRENISGDNSFILKNERCPFLNRNNLCDIIINCGEDRLCQICRDHPRYFEWYSNIKEGGIGLSCEEGARLILTCDKVTYDETEVDEDEEEVDEELFSLLFSAREEIFSLLCREDCSFYENACDILTFADKLQFLLDNPHLSQEDYVPCDTAECENAWQGVLGFFGKTEPIDEKWNAEHAKLCTQKAENVENSERAEAYMRNIFRYFIWRYFLKGVFDGEILSKVKLAAVSALVINKMTEGSDELGVWIEKSKLYSKQTEYSDENRELFYDLSYEMECFSVTILNAQFSMLNCGGILMK